MASDHDRVMNLLLLRHGQIASHRGDVPLTAAGERTATEAGTSLAGIVTGPVEVRYGSTLRAQQTANHVAKALAERAIHLVAGQPRAAFALRNPDLYLAGERVEMVSSPDALADQVPALTPDQCAAHSWFAAFMSATDRVGWWLRHTSPPGDDAGTVARRIMAFARSLTDRPRPCGDLIGITYSPILRSIGLAMLNEDPGELGHLTGYRLAAAADGSVVATRFDPFVEAPALRERSAPR